MSYPNDNYADATTLTGASGSITPFHYDGIGDPAGSETGENVYGAGETLWWKWTATDAGTVSFTTSGSTSDDSDPDGLDTKLQLFDDTGFSSSHRLARNDDGDDVALEFNSRADCAVTAGQTIYIQVDQYGSGQAGTLHLSWAFSAPGAFTISAIRSAFSGSLANDILLPSIGGETFDATISGSGLTGLTTILFPGGATATITVFNDHLAGFTMPLVGADLHSGNATITNGATSVEHPVTILKPETPGFGRTYTPRDVTGYIAWASSAVGPGSYAAVALARRGTDLADAMSSDDGTHFLDLGSTRDGEFSAQAPFTEIDDTTRPPAKTYGMVLVRVGWGPSVGAPGLSWSYSDITGDDAPVPADQWVAERSEIHFGTNPYTQRVQDHWTGAPATIEFPLAGMAFDKPWSDFTAEVYAIPAADLISEGSTIGDPAAFDYPSPGPTLYDWWLPPSWFSDHDPLAVVELGSIAGYGTAFAEPTISVPLDRIWEGLADDSLYSVFAVIMKQYRQDADDEGPGLPDSPGTQGWIRFSPHPNDETAFSPGNQPAQNLAVSVPTQEAPYRYWIPDNVLTTLPPLRQVGRADRSRQYPRAHVDGSRQTGRIP